MPILPSGRRIEFSIDRFHAMLARMPAADAKHIVNALQEPNDLLYVMDLVEFSPIGKPFLANKIAADFQSYAIAWSHDDQDALASWITSDSASKYRSEAIATLRSMVAQFAECNIQSLQAA